MKQTSKELRLRAMRDGEQFSLDGGVYGVSKLLREMHDIFLCLYLTFCLLLLCGALDEKKYSDTMFKLNRSDMTRSGSLWTSSDEKLCENVFFYVKVIFVC